MMDSPANERVYASAYHKSVVRGVRYLLCVAAAAVAAACLLASVDVTPFVALPLFLWTAGRVYALHALRKHRLRFEACGDPEENERQFDAEFGDRERQLRFDHFLVTRNWLYCDEPDDLFLMPLTGVAWIYERREDNVSQLVIHFRDGSRQEMHLSREDITALMAVVQTINPKAVAGYSEQLEHTYNEDRERFVAELGEAPKRFVGESSPFPRACYETIVYVWKDGEKRKGHLGLTRDMRLVLTRDGETLFDRGVDAVAGVRLGWFGRIRFEFTEPGWEEYPVKTYNGRTWRAVIAKARRGESLATYADKGYFDVDSHNFAVNQNRFYMRYASRLLSLLFFAAIFYHGVKDDMLWEDGVFMGVATYFLLPLLVPPIALTAIMYMKGLQGIRLFPNRKDGE